MTDWERLKELETLQRGNQYGFTAKVRLAGVQGSQVLRFQGDVYDITPWRVYLGQWRPRGDIVVPADVYGNSNSISSMLAYPSVPEITRPPQLSMCTELCMYAQLRWGSGGFNHAAWVDWPVRGLLCQVSGNYVEVNAVALYTPPRIVDPTDIADTQLPDLSATLSLEPGGGDAAAAGTFTYPLQTTPGGDWSTAPTDPKTGRPGINFAVPPFARAARILLDGSQGSTFAVDPNTDYATTAYIRMRRSNGGNDDDLVAVFDYSETAQLSDFLAGLPVPAGCAYVRVEFDFPSGAPTSSSLAYAGVCFELDL